MLLLNSITCVTESLLLLTFLLTLIFQYVKERFCLLITPLAFASVVVTCWQIRQTMGFEPLSPLLAVCCLYILTPLVLDLKTVCLLVP